MDGAPLPLLVLLFLLPRIPPKKSTSNGRERIVLSHFMNYQRANTIAKMRKMVGKRRRSFIDPVVVLLLLCLKRRK